VIGLFGPRLPVDDDELEFQLATSQWLEREFGAAGDSPLVLPTPEYFPSVRAAGTRAGVRELFDDVRRAAGMADWRCELTAGAGDRPVEAGNAHLLRHEGPAAPCGTFRIAEDDAGRHANISYNPDMAHDQAALTATFAHELGHYLMATSRGVPPGGWDLHELHTDLAAVYLGFGVFLANSARHFAQYLSAGTMGWSSRMQGYLSEGALVTALAIFQRLAGRDPLEPEPWLKDYLRKDLRRAARGLAKRHPDMAASVGAVDLAEYGGG
jgi:hypothetical protein